MSSTTTPRAGTWLLDPDATTVAFSGRASRFSPMVQARFADVAGTVVATGDLRDTVVDVTVDVRSMTSGNRAWDELVATVDPFTAGSFPSARYRSTAVRECGDTALIDGVLELRGVSRPLRLEARHATSPCGGRLSISASGEVDREHFGVRCDVPGAGLLIPRRLRLTIDVVAFHEQELLAA